MKDSGVEWIGMIPDGWSVERNKNLFRCSKEIVGEKSTSIQLLSLTTHGIKEKSKDDVGGKVPESYDTYQIVKKNDLVMCLFDLDCSAVFSGLSAYDGMISPAYRVLSVSDLAKAKFYDYWFMYVADGRKFNHYAKNLRFTLNYDEFAVLPAVCPSLSEQQRIADFLDAKCAAIDDVIAKTNESIEEYKKLKQAVITEAVTKGVRGKRPMKDSGIDWIGQIPKEWTTSRINRIGKTSSGATPLRSKEKDFFVDADIGWVRSLDLNDGLVYDSDEKITQDALDSSACSIMPIDTVCVAMYGGSGTIGKCGLLKKAMATNQAVCSIVCNKSIILPLFLLYQLICIKPYWMIFAVGTRKDPNINQEIVMKMPVVIPSLDEQREIADYLDSKCTAIDTLISKKQQFIDELTAYKKSLIYEYVTGKKEVPA